MNLAIATEPFDSPDARRLVAALDAHLASRYPPEQRFGPHLKAEHVAGVGKFVIARLEPARPQACTTFHAASTLAIDPGLRRRGSAGREEKTAW
jgi:hypothetical protein